MSDLPNLYAMRVLAAVARHGSFTRAADELGVTQPAVSKQIAALEASLGQALFLRFHRRIELTPYGAEVAAAAQAALDHLKARLSAIDAGLPEQLKIAGDADFLQLWLFPRLPDFEARHPEVRISLTARVGMNAPPTDDYDCAVIWGRGGWAGCVFDHVLSNRVFPVAAPGFLDRIGRPARLADIAERYLIHDQTRLWWATFRQQEGADALSPGAGRLYNQSVLCLDAAARGDGVTIGDEVTAGRYLFEGRLLVPFRARLDAPDGYYLALPAGRRRSEALTVFVDWLRAEAEAHRRAYDVFWQAQGGEDLRPSRAVKD